MSLQPTRAVDLGALVGELDELQVFGDLDRVVNGIAHDSRAVHVGSLFVALRGERHDGHAWLEQAIAAGARAVVVDAAFARAHPLPAGATVIVVPQSPAALSRLAAAVYGRPSSALIVVGVTGTNGKTTTTSLIAAIANAAGIPTGRIGTLGAHLGGAMWGLDFTTPFPPQLHGLLAEMRDRGAEAAALEVSSHALALGRVDDVQFALGVLTNVTRDHLDFHGSFEAYAAAKRTLFERTSDAILNVDDPLGRRWAAALAARGREVVGYGFAEGAAVRAEALELHGAGSRFAVGGQAYSLPLPGRFNVHNALAAIAVARALGIDDRRSAQTLAQTEGVPGRMEHVGGNGIDCVVDYAHTPDALAVALGAAREATRGRLIVVFGCGGDRDRGKRAQMGRIACELADLVIVTSDNPRSEQPEAIARDILAGIPPRHPHRLELDRRAAIGAAVAAAQPGDVVLVAGKGHEAYQLIGQRAERFDDREEVRAALARRAAEVPSGR